MTKFIFVTGGVVSGIGKGIAGASIGRMLKNRGLKVFMQKFDPYINIDPGTMSPYQHGEVFVTKDGAETDLDLGHYERFIDEELTKVASVTAGKIYSRVINKERRGDYEGGTVQVIPHITDEIKNCVYKAAEQSKADVVITEIGGTVGDIESNPFLEAIRQIHSENQEDVLFVHTVLVPAIPGSKELKTKPTQHSFKSLMSYGIKADVIITRAEYDITDEIKEKISLFCDVPIEAIIESKTVDLIYEVPIVFHEQGLDNFILDKLNLKPKHDSDRSWYNMVEEFKKAYKKVDIALVGKYTQLHDSYISVNQALYDAGYVNGADVTIHWIESEKITRDNVEKIFDGMDGIIVPGGFGARGSEGMILSSKYARENNIPYLGICYGMQMVVIDLARNVLGYESANTTEIDPDTKYPVISLLDNHNPKEDIGGTLRLGDYECSLKEGSLARELYGKEKIIERHRHRYEVNNEYVKKLEEVGMVVSGRNEDLDVTEMIELKDHKFFVACQFHPEFKSRPNNVAVLFKGFIKATLK